MAVFNIDNLISASLLKLVGTIDDTTANPTVDLSPVSALKVQVDNTPANDVVITEILLTMSANVVDANGDLLAERMWLTGGAEVTLTDGSVVMRYTATIRGILNANKTNEPVAADGGTRNFQSHNNSARCVVDESWLMRNLADLFTPASIVTTSTEAGEDVAIRRAVVAASADGKFLNYKSGELGFIGISDQALTNGNNFSIPTFNNIVNGFSGLTPGGTVFADFVVAPGAATAAIASPAAPGDVDDGAHDYKVTLVTAQGETIGGTASGSVTIADKSVNGKIELTAIPISTNGNVTARKIYRRFNAAGTYKLLTTIAENTTTIFTDNVANASLGADIQTVTTNDGLITQLATTTSTPIGSAPNATSVKILAFAPLVAVFKDGDLQIINTADGTKVVDFDNSGLLTGVTQTIAFVAQLNSVWTVPSEGAAEIFASQDFANSATTGAALTSRVASETLSKGETVFLDTPSTFALAVGIQNFGRISTNRVRSSFAVIGNGTAMTSMKLALGKVGTPTDNAVIRIETDNAGDPSGSLFDSNATSDISGAGLSTSLVDTTVSFDGSFTPTAATKFHVVYERDGSDNNSNHFITGFRTRDSFYGLKKFTTVWADETSRQPYFSAAAGFESTVVTKTDATKGDQIKLFGFANAAITEFTAGNFDKKGITNTQTGLTLDASHFLSDTPGAISNTPGTITVFVGDSVSATAIAIKDTQFPIVTFEGHKTANQTISSSPVTVTWVENIDLKRELVSGIFTCDDDGYRIFTFHINLLLAGAASNKIIEFDVEKNGNTVRRFALEAFASSGGNVQFELMGSAVFEDFMLKGDTIKLVVISQVGTVNIVGDTGGFAGDSYFHVVQLQ